jgi:wobble nucleotide-excising tRNase
MGVAAGVTALVALEKKFSDYEKDMQSTKKDVGDISDQLKKLDALLDNVKPKQ